MDSESKELRSFNLEVAAVVSCSESGYNSQPDSCGDLSPVRRNFTHAIPNPLAHWGYRVYSAKRPDEVDVRAIDKRFFGSFRLVRAVAISKEKTIGGA